MFYLFSIKVTGVNGKLVAGEGFSSIIISINQALQNKTFNFVKIKTKEKLIEIEIGFLGIMSHLVLKHRAEEFNVIRNSLCIYGFA